jgi:hypothetical protein
MKRIVIFLFSYFKKRSFDKNCQDVQSTFSDSWNQIYDLLSKSPFWKMKLSKNINDNEISYFNTYSNVFKESFHADINPLNGEKILFWAQSGGTSGSSKFFPITPSYLKDFQETIPAFVHNLVKYNKSLFSRETKVLYLVSSMTQEKTDAGISKGYLSTFNYLNTSSLLASSYVLPKSVFQSNKLFTQRVCLYALSANLSAILSVTPLAIDLFLENIKSNWDQYLLHLQNKSLIDEIEQIPISPSRLKYIMNLTSYDLNFKSLWPELEFVCCWKTSVCESQSKTLQQKFGAIKMLDAIYSATEGWMNIPFGIPEKNGGPINLMACLCEFMEINGDKILKPWELHVGKKYEVLLTNSMGLVRYRLNDIILCTGYYFQTPIIEFVSKKDGELSLGMAVIAENEITAIIGEYFKTKKYLVCPNDKVNGLIIYTDNFDILENDLSLLDSKLQDINANYKVYRLNNTLERIQYKKLDNSEIWSKEKNYNFDNAQKKPKFLYQEFPTWIEKKDKGPV